MVVAKAVTGPDIRAGHTRAEAPPGPGREIVFRLLALAFYLGLSAIKMRAYLASGRFWAEEGKIYFSGIKRLPFWDALTYQYHGHLELSTNAVVLLASQVPFKYAPLVTSYASFALQTIPILMVGYYRRALGVSREGLLALGLVLVGLPQAAEVWANAINLHFHFALLAALIAALNANGVALGPSMTCLLALAGLSGIPANFLLPVFVFLALSRKSAALWRHAGVLATTTAVQIALLFGNDLDTGERDLLSSPVNYWLAMLSHQLLTPLAGYEQGQELADTLKLVVEDDATALALALACSVPFAWLLLRTLRSQDASGRVLVVSAFLLMLMSAITSLGDHAGLVAALSGGRYFFASNVLLTIFLLGLTARAKASWLALLWGPLLMASAERVEFYLGGHDWREQYADAMERRSERVVVWPGNGKWTVDNFDLAHDP